MSSVHNVHITITSINRSSKKIQLIAISCLFVMQSVNTCACVRISGSRGCCKNCRNTSPGTRKTGMFQSLGEHLLLVLCRKVIETHMWDSLSVEHRIETVVKYNINEEYLQVISIKYFFFFFTNIK